MKILVVVEDDPDMRMAIRIVLSTEPRVQVEGEASSIDEAVKVAQTVKPELIILDHSIEGEVMGADGAPMLKKAAPRAKVLLFSAYDLEARAMEDPAIDAFLRKDEIEDLLPTVERLLGLRPPPRGAG